MGSRIIGPKVARSISNEGDVVLDPFCGCGTTIAAAQKLNREWIGIDVTHLTVGLMKLRLKDSFNMLPLKSGSKAASPLAERKSSAFPEGATQDLRGSAADPRHSLEDSLEDRPAKQSFAARREAESEEIPTTDHCPLLTASSDSPRTLTARRNWR